ncbi:MAG: glycoside hydrolase family 127 protein [Firmicutes bacterium]|jgi:DUF1680 family protein|nr:glycoside hydrolase family 127 protein [Bacillota bacterium]
MRNSSSEFCRNVRLRRGLLAERAEVVREKVIPYQWKALNDDVPGAEPSFAIENLRIAAGEKDGEFRGWVFQDSDVAKWLEAVAYRLMAEPHPEWEARADEVIDLVERAQQADGYLNSYYTITAPQERWTNLRDKHELYCAGHFIEAGVAYYQATGKDKLLQVVCRLADHICEVFGPHANQKRGYPGHEEIELALVKLYRVTQKRAYLELAEFFIEERGRQPHYFTLEALARGEDPREYRFDYAYSQSHLPLREQTTVEGHAVRAMYLLAAAADLALEKDDPELQAVCERLWNNVVQRRMYITGAIGSAGHHEGFTIDYDLPNDLAYAETCAAIGLVFWAQRMLQLAAKAEYADVMERALYNGVLSGMSLEGTKFFYVNPLEVDPRLCAARYELRETLPERQEWFGCACCPPNLARLLASINSYIYSANQTEVFVHLFADSTATIQLGGEQVVLVQQTDYPWDEHVQISIHTPKPALFTLSIRIPGWCTSPVVRLGDERLSLRNVEDGYLRLHSRWSDGDTISLTFPMPVVRVWANPLVADNVGKVALQRGPIVYCFEEVDNGANLAALCIPENAAFVAERDPALQLPALVGPGLRITAPESGLYTTARPVHQAVTLKAVPYFAWSNRGRGEMRIWLNELELGPNLH